MKGPTSLLCDLSSLMMLWLHYEGDLGHQVVFKLLRYSWQEQLAHAAP